MMQLLRARFVKAILLASLLAALTATPFVTDVVGLERTASADHCGGSSC